MSLYSIQDTTLTDIADAIRSKTGKTASMTPAEMVDEIESISGGGSSTLIDKTITENGTYLATDDSADGYSSVTVNVQSSGSSGWTKVAETSYQVSTTETGSREVDTWATGHSELWTSDKIVYVRIRDTAGKRNGYFYGTDQFFFNLIPINGYSGVLTTDSIRTCIRYSNNVFAITTIIGTSGYGVFADQISSSGGIRIKRRYNGTNSLTIDGTYKVEVYLLDPPTGAPIFE